MQCCGGVRRLESYSFRADGGLRRRKVGGEGIEERWMKWKRSRGSKQFEGQEVFKGERVGRQTEGKLQDRATKWGWERGITFEKG